MLVMLTSLREQTGHLTKADLSSTINTQKKEIASFGGYTS